jgi:hypothetical protein
VAGVAAADPRPTCPRFQVEWREILAACSYTHVAVAALLHRLGASNLSDFEECAYGHRRACSGTDAPPRAGRRTACGEDLGRLGPDLHHFDRDADRAQECESSAPRLRTHQSKPDAADQSAPRRRPWRKARRNRTQASARPRRCLWRGLGAPARNYRTYSGLSDGAGAFNSSPEQGGPTTPPELAIASSCPPAAAK